MLNAGVVYLVGAGPGDPGLLTVRGLECLKEAEVVIYDRLMDRRILSHVNPRAEKIFAGRGGTGHVVPQREVNEILVRMAKDGKKVVRLKGGDPFVFGRGGEEAEYLTRERIPFEIVPGVTSAIACPAYAGIPVTHRRFTSTVTLITGHEDPEKKSSSIDWDSLGRGNGTLIFLMGVSALESIAAELIKHGRTPSTPVAVIRWGTRPYQEVCTGQLWNIAGLAKEKKLGPPAVTIVGEVVSLREKLMWYERKPLFGRSVIVTRAKEQAGVLAGSLEELGARVFELPMIRILPLDDLSALKEALCNLGRYDWIVFTSANAVPIFMSSLWAMGLDARALFRIKIAAIGSGTSRELEKYNLRCDIIPEDFIAEGLLACLSKCEIKGKRFLLPRAQDARDVLPEGLAGEGALVDVIPIYRNVVDEDPEMIESILSAGKIDLLTFTSSSAVRNFHRIAKDKLRDVIAGAKTVCIGPQTAETARELGYNVDAEASEHTIDGLIAACIAASAA